MAAIAGSKGDQLQAAHRSWATEMVNHRKHCARCNHAVKARRLDTLCDYGSDVIVRLRRASQALADYEADQERQAAGQQLLFNLTE